jgi:L-histidine Nalpha-methyltransferase
MEPITSVLIHSSRYPDAVRRAYIESFRSRRMNHQFHYDTEKQAQQWLAIHEAYSPARRDQDCLATYQSAFRDAASEIKSRPLTVLSLGCGGGQKDVALLSAFGELDQILYVPTDVSLPLTLTAHLAAKTSFPAINSQPAILDLSKTEDLNSVSIQGDARLITFFGMIPNFEPTEVFPQLSTALRGGDHLLLSVNLAPASNYSEGVQRILPQYQNQLTRRWLATVLLDAGLELNPEEIEFQIADQGSLKRIEAGYRFQRRQTLRLDHEEFAFQPGEWFQLFFSYRHTPALLRDLLASYQIDIVQQSITTSAEEGVFLCRKAT